MTEPLVSIEDVSFSYAPDRTVLSGCHFRLDPHQRVGLIGPNGSGKTTLLALIVGLLQPQRGRVVVFGQQRAGEADFHDVRRRVGLLFQDADNQLFCPTVAEDVAFGPLNLGKPRHEISQIIAQTLRPLGLTGYEDRITQKLSGGEKRLVALATVLAMGPDVLLLDEPISGLDEESARRVGEILLALPQAMVIVSHDRRFLEKMAPESLLLAGGRVQRAESRPREP